MTEHNGTIIIKGTKYWWAVVTSGNTIQVGIYTDRRRFGKHRPDRLIDSIEIKHVGGKAIHE